MIHPLNSLREASKELPILKYGWGIVGIVSVLAFALKLNIGLTELVVGTIIVFALMFILPIFAVTTKWGKRKLNIVALFLTWAFSILLVLVPVFLCSSYFFEWPLRISPGINGAKEEMPHSGGIPQQGTGDNKVPSYFSLDLLPERITISHDAKIQITPRTFCVTEDNCFLISDTQTRTIKVLEKEENYLKFVKSFGVGNESFIEPGSCFYSRNAGIFGIIDNGVEKGFIFDKFGKVDFMLIKNFACKPNCYDIEYDNDGKQVVVSGYVTDNENNPFDLYSVNIETGHIDYLLPSYEKYGLKSYEDYKLEYFTKQTLPAIGIKAFIDIQGDDLFFAWEGALRIIKFNIRTKKITRVFGQATLNYNKPVGSKLNDSYIKEDFQTTWKEQKTVAYVRNIFATIRYVFLVYETGITHEREASTFRVQTYTLDGAFLTDDLLTGTLSKQMWLSKESYELYAFTGGTGSDNGEFAILKYKIK